VTSAVREREKARWSEDIYPLLSMALQLTPEDLPEAPWVLASTVDRQIGKTFVPAAPYARVTNNENWLRGLQLEIRRGPSGPRARTGVLREDLVNLARVIEEKKA
jgi:hypothetical protein